MSETHTTSVCDECPGRCCTNRRWIFSAAQLYMNEAEHPKIAPHVEWHPNPDDPKREQPWLPLAPRCPLLGKDNRCTIYEDRPASCRAYVCHEAPDLIEYLGNYPTHMKLLKKHGKLPPMIT